MDRRKWLIAFSLGVAAAPLSALAQQKGKVWRIGFLGAGRASAYAHRIDALRAGLRDLGYIEGKNLVIDYRWAEGNYDRLPQLAVEIVGLKIDVLVTHSTPGTRAARQASATLPIVMTDVVDAVGMGLVESLARPGGNITGSSFIGPQLIAKRLEMLKETLPAMSRVALLVNPNNPALATIRKEMAAAARSSKVELQEFEARQPGDFETALQAMARSRIDAVMVQEDPLFTVNTGTVASLAIKYRLPLAGFSEFAEAGGVIGYGVNFPDLYRRASYFVDRILKGAKPGDLPVEQPTKFELVINMKTAKALGLTIPQSILVRADRVIE
jgi:putative ABC transport system substrate-binding protein